MKRNNNEGTSVYSTSAIDLFCSAMGVFMLICFIAFAQIKEETPPEPMPSPPEPAPPAPPPEPTPPAPAPPQTKRGLPDPMMVAVCKWELQSDVDLCVRYHSPGQTSCWFAYGESRRTHSDIGFYGGLLHDDRGAGRNQVKTEQWALFATKVGTYEVYLSLYGNSPATQVKTELMTEDEVIEGSYRPDKASTWLHNSNETLERDHNNAIRRGLLIPIGKFEVRQEGDRKKVKISTAR